MTGQKDSFAVKIWGNELQLQTCADLFSPRGPDAGTLALLDTVELRPDDRVLDLGCGYGLIGLAVARQLGTQAVVMIDIDPLAVQTARENAATNDCASVPVLLGDGPSVTGRRFTLILCNPPYHTDFSVARQLIEDSYRCLEAGGRLYLVVKRLTWYRNKIAALFGGVTVKAVNGYFVVIGIRTLQDNREDKRSARQPPKKATRKHARRIELSQKKKRKPRP